VNIEIWGLALSPPRGYGVKKYAPLRIGYQFLWIRVKN
jgi:hypothetical protein